MPELPQRLIAGLAGIAALAVLGCGAEPAEPRLALLLVVDQLRADRLDPSLPGGLGRLAREGRVFADAALAHADSETCPGHVAAATGRHPGSVGVPGNHFVDPASDEVRYCVADADPGAQVLDGGPGRSPRAIEADGLGDWLRAARPGTRVFSVSGKDRAAISLGGQRPDGVYWLDRRGALGFTTSAYYRDALPAWATAFNGSGPAGGFVGRLPATWEHATGAPANGARADAHPREVDRFSATSPHPVVHDERAITLDALYFSPFLDEVTLEFALELIANEGLGSGPAVDLLALSLSAIDLVGHGYGPWSQESRDALLRLDAALGRFLDALEARLGRDSLVVALTSDHGVLALPEWLWESGTSDCPVRGGRVVQQGLAAALEYALGEAFGSVGEEAGPWLARAGYRFRVRRARAEAAGVPVARVIEEASAMLVAQPVVERVWTAQEMAAAEGPEPFATLYHNSHHAERGGDFAVQTRRDCLVALYPAGTTHGTPYPYDRAVPLVFWGRGVEPGVVRGRAASVDLAPTLSTLLGVDPPAGLDGQILPLAAP